MGIRTRTVLVATVRPRADKGGYIPLPLSRTCLTASALNSSVYFRFTIDTSCRFQFYSIHVSTKPGEDHIKALLIAAKHRRLEHERVFRLPRRKKADVDLPFEKLSDD
jgi:hypothetical protein